MSRLAEAFERLKAEKRGGLITYVTAGDPDLAQSREVLSALERAGADIIEVGVPFSDPIADGPAIQRASERALAAGGGLRATLELLAGTAAPTRPPIVLFTYVNPVLRMGMETFAERAAAVGVDGVLLLDLPIEEAGAARQVFDRHGLDLIFLVSPTTTGARLAEAARLGRGFLYAISRLGVTGTRETVSASAEPLVARLRATTALPIAVGFGISTAGQVADVWRFSDAAVVGSALVEAIAGAAVAGEPVAARAETFVRSLTGGSPSALKER